VVDILADENDGDYSPATSRCEAIGLANGKSASPTITFALGLNGGTITLVLANW
jgi:hypothetical protein